MIELLDPRERPRVDEHPRVVVLPRTGLPIGDRCAPVLIAGPCAVESEAQIHAIAAAVAAAGGSVLRGGAFKPRTSPYAFAGHGRPALGWMRDAARAHGLAVVTEVLASADAEFVAEHADLLQIGSRTMQAFDLLRAVGRTGRPVLLKRGMAATVEEWLSAAEHLLDAGAAGVVLCERGIRAFAQPTRNTLDLGAVAWVLERCRLPVVVDPSHAAGQRELVPRLARAAIALGAHGVMLEVHPVPQSALSDGEQAVALADLADVAADLRRALP